MATRKSSGGPVYQMNSFAGSRQPEGPSPRALELLQEPGPLGPRPTLAPTPAVAPAAPVPEPTPAPVTAAKSEPVLTAPRSADVLARPPRRAPASSRRPKPPPADNYALPPPGASKPKARPNHFRLPSDVEARLTELADTHGCSRTRVVCSAITSEWQRMQRRKTRAAKVDEK